MSNPRPRPSTTGFRFSSPIAWASGASALLHLGGLTAVLMLIGHTAPEPAFPGARIELRVVEIQGAVQAHESAAWRDPSPNPLPQGEGVGGRGATGNSTTNALATGPGVVPARLDAHWLNREPVYPLDAARRREAGTVLLLAHVGPDGAVRGVDVATSSGFPQLDRVARVAVATWHFLPAVHDGRPVASDMPLRVVFQLN